MVLYQAKGSILRPLEKLVYEYCIYYVASLFLGWQKFHRNGMWHFANIVVVDKRTKWLWKLKTLLGVFCLVYGKTISIIHPEVKI